MVWSINDVAVALLQTCLFSNLKCDVDQASAQLAINSTKQCCRTLPVSSLSLSDCHLTILAVNIFYIHSHVVSWDANP